MLFDLVTAIGLTLSLTLPPHQQVILIHDWKKPELDGWYESLHRKGANFPCCSKNDCHPTDAELRNGQWWARIGFPVTGADGHVDWQLGQWVKIDDYLILRGPNGNAIPNPEGEAVICHSIAWSANGKIDAAHTQIYCFVPGTES